MYTWRHRRREETAMPVLLWALVATLFICVILLILLSIVTIESGSVGAVFRFGKFRRVLTPGLKLIIPLLEMVEEHSTQTHQNELPDEPENIDRTSDVPAEGKKHPYRVIFSGKEEANFYRKKPGKEKSPGLLKNYDVIRYTDLSEDEKRALDGDSIHAPLTGEVAVVVEWHLEEGAKSMRRFIE